jgi:hypothetical protein
VAPWSNTRIVISKSARDLSVHTSTCFSIDRSLFLYYWQWIGRLRFLSCIPCLLTDGIIVSDYSALGDWIMVNMNQKGFGRKGLGLNFKYSPDISLQGCTRSKETFRQGSWCPSRHWNGYLANTGQTDYCLLTYLLCDRGSIPGRNTQTILAPTQPPIYRLPWAFSWGIKRPRQEAKNSFDLVSKLRICGATPSFSPMFVVWCLRKKHEMMLCFPAKTENLWWPELLPE